MSPDLHDKAKEAVQRIRTLFGEGFDELYLIDERKKDLPFYSLKRHRLMALIRAVLNSNKEGQEVIAEHELYYTVELFEKWSKHPLWNDIAKHRKDPGQYAHSVFTLAIAGSFNGGMISLHPPAIADGQRFPDLLIQSNNKELTIEVKSPQILIKPDPNLNEQLSDQLIEKLMRKASTKAGGQLGPEKNRLLVIGGFHMGERDFIFLENAAKKYLKERGETRKHLHGITMLSISVMFEGVELEPPDTLISNNREVATHTWVRSRIIPNPHYTGNFRISTTLGSMAGIQEVQAERIYIRDKPLTS